MLAGDEFLHAIHWSEPEFTCIACGPFTKNKERIQKLKINWRIKKYIYQNVLDKAWF